MSTRILATKYCLALAVCALAAAPAAGGSNAKKLPTSIKSDDFQLTLSSKPYVQDPTAAYTRQICQPRKKPGHKAKKATN